MMDLTRGLQNIVKQVNVQTNIEAPAAALTLTRSTNLAIATAGTTVIWQTETRNNGFTWSGTDITIPASGYYSVQCFFLVSNNMTLQIQRVINGTIVGGFVVLQNLTTNYFPATMTRYFTAGDIFAIRLIPSTASFITVAVEGTASEAPILHIVQLTGAV